MSAYDLNLITIGIKSKGDALHTTLVWSLLELDMFLRLKFFTN